MGCCGKLGKDVETKSLLEPFNIVSKNLWFWPAGANEPVMINKRTVAPRQNLLGRVSSGSVHRSGGPNRAKAVLSLAAELGKVEESFRWHWF